MTLITFSDGKVVMKGDAVGTEQACCCGGGDPCDCEPGECCIANYDEEGNFLGSFSCEPGQATCDCYMVFVECASAEDCEQQPSDLWCGENTPNYQRPGVNGEARTFAYAQNAQDYADSLDMPDGCIALVASAAQAGAWPHYSDCVDQFFDVPDIGVACCRGASEDAGNPLP